MFGPNSLRAYPQSVEGLMDDVSLRDIGVYVEVLDDNVVRLYSDDSDSGHGTEITVLHTTDEAAPAYRASGYNTAHDLGQGTDHEI